MYPDEVDAEFPQFKKQPLIDFRNAHIDVAGYEFSGSHRTKQNVKGKTIDTKIDIEEQSEDKKDSEAEEEEPEDLLNDFGKMKLEVKKKAKKGNRMTTEDNSGFLSLKTKQIKKTKKQDCKKSKKSMRF